VLTESRRKGQHGNIYWTDVALYLCVNSNYYRNGVREIFVFRECVKKQNMNISPGNRRKHTKTFKEYPGGIGLQVHDSYSLLFRVEQTGLGCHFRTCVTNEVSVYPPFSTSFDLRTVMFSALVTHRQLAITRLRLLASQFEHLLYTRRTTARK
jgi:hypothetical protein